MDKTEKDIKILISAKYPIIYIVSWEEERVEESLIKIAENFQKNLLFWDSSNGFVNAFTNEKNAIQDPEAAVNYALRDDEDNTVFAFKDLHHFMDSPRLIRKLRDLSKEVIQSAKSCVILSPVLKIPAAA
ncbi:MAG: hypothetical protein LBR69_01225 [Endomicrobium sp.]|jgi:hypothetical protein|nr:hypothetical protein [Endomicrobium sp.]